MQQPRSIFEVNLFQYLIRQAQPINPPPPLGGPCGYQLGFATLRNMIVASNGDIVGGCLENEWHNADNGDGLQRSSGRGGGSIGMMVWRKADNWTAYTDGYQTWLNGPCGRASCPCRQSPA